MNKKLFNFVMAMVMGMTLLGINIQDVYANQPISRDSKVISASTSELMMFSPHNNIESTLPQKTKCQTTTWTAYGISKTLKRAVIQYTQSMYWCFDGKKVSQVKTWTSSEASWGWKYLGQQKVQEYRRGGRYYYSKAIAKFGYLCGGNNCSVEKNLVVTLTPYYYGNIGKSATTLSVKP